MLTAVASDPHEGMPALSHSGMLSCRWLPGIPNSLGGQAVRYRLSQCVGPSSVDGIKERVMDPYSKPRCFVRHDRAFLVSSLQMDPRAEWKDLNA
jgi:hypothetical protein